MTVRVDDAGFDLHRSGTPTIGMLPPSAMAVLGRLTGRLDPTITDDRRRGAAPKRRSENRAKRAQHPRRGRQAPIIIGVRPQPRVPTRGRV